MAGMVDRRVDVDAEMVNHREQRIVIPDELKVSVRQSLAELAEIVESKKPVIITIDRSGTLLAEAMWSDLEAKGIEVDKEDCLRLHVGRSMADGFDIGKYGLSEFLPIDWFVEEQVNGYLGYLDQNVQVQEKVRELTERIERLDVEARKEILVIADSSHIGITMGLTVPYVVLSALKKSGIGGYWVGRDDGFDQLRRVVNDKLGTGDKGVEVMTKCLLGFRHQGWLGKVIQASFPEWAVFDKNNDPLAGEKYALGFLVKEVLRGEMEVVRGCVKIVTVEQIEELGLKWQGFVERAHKMKCQRNPVDLWRDMYGDEKLEMLLDLNRKLVGELVSLGRSDVMSRPPRHS
jgi:hypothetical protein